jgi:hypothetical protein
MRGLTQEGAMTRRVYGRWAWGFTLTVTALTVGAACSGSTNPHTLIYCPSYGGGNASDTMLAGPYTLVSFCQDTVPPFGPAQGVTGSLILTATAPTVPDSFKAIINFPTPPSTNLVGSYHVSHDTIAVTFQLGQFVGVYSFYANTLKVSGSLPAGGATPQPIAIIFAK